MLESLRADSIVVDAVGWQNGVASEALIQALVAQEDDMVVIVTIRGTAMGIVDLQNIVAIDTLIKTSFFIACTRNRKPGKKTNILVIAGGTWTIERVISWAASKRQHVTNSVLLAIIVGEGPLVLFF